MYLLTIKMAQLYSRTDIQRLANLGQIQFIIRNNIFPSNKSTLPESNK
jgi:hypothetical protein